MMALPIEDIIPPAEPGFWPLAPGWWLLLLALIAMLSWSVYRLWTAWPHWQARRRLLRAITTAHSAADLNRLLKAYAVRWLKAPASAQGDEWIAWLLQHAEALDAPEREQLKQLGEAPYRPPVPGETELLKVAVCRWIRKVKP